MSSGGKERQTLLLSLKYAAGKARLANDGDESSYSNFAVQWNGNRNGCSVSLLLVNIMVPFAMPGKGKTICRQQVTDFPPRQDAQFSQKRPRCLSRKDRNKLRCEKEDAARFRTLRQPQRTTQSRQLRLLSLVQQLRPGWRYRVPGTERHKYLLQCLVPHGGFES